ncbi:MAG TPA: DUF885 domain-containing protein [Bryobacteraceae bacterium]|jgi:uncharacterized protein (DUF885 family)|nr:DUF885 domain-containing protein [Bryobacteraceae bacterium]
MVVTVNSCAPRSDATQKLKTIKDDWWEWFQRENPETASQLGEYKYNDKLSDGSLSHVPQVRNDVTAFLTRLHTIPASSLSDADQLDQSLLVRVLEDTASSIDLKTYEMPVDQFNGIHLTLPQIPTYAPFDSVKHYDDYIARLKQIPLSLDQATEVMKQGMRDGLMPPAYLLEKTLPQIDDIVKPAGLASPFAISVAKIPESFSAADKQRLQNEIVAAIDTEVRPAYAKLRQFIAADYAPKGRKEPGVWALPNGDQLYRFDIHNLASSSKTPEEIHQLGLAQVADIEAQIDALGKKAGFKDGKAFQKATLADPKYMAKSREQILDAYRHYIEQMEPKLPQLFGRLPKARVTVTSVPAFMEKDGSTEYMSGTPDGSRAGQVWVDTYDPAHHNMLEDEATAYHEGIPGHHMQISIAQELPLHPFHHALGFNAYVEGWALYAERVGKEVGFYQDPASDLGRLQSELFRAVRLVVDTGVHYKHWTRQQMVDYFNEHYAAAPQSEVDRYIAWPGQALGYKLGQLEILDLRQRAQTQLGSKFDIRAFHDEVLGAGALPLELLDARLTKWIATQNNPE